MKILFARSAFVARLLIMIIAQSISPVCFAASSTEKRWLSTFPANSWVSKSLLCFLDTFPALRASCSVNFAHIPLDVVTTAKPLAVKQLIALKALGFRFWLVMFSVSAPAIKKLEILYSVVVNFSVNMMNGFLFSEKSPKERLHDQSMLWNITIFGSIRVMPGFNQNISVSSFDFSAFPIHARIIFNAHCMSISLCL